MTNRYVHSAITIILLACMCVAAVALWRGIIPIEWLTSLGYEGIFVLSLVNGVAPVAGPSQIATFFVASKLNPLLVGLVAGIGGAIGELAGYAFGYSLRAAQPDDVERRIHRIANWRFLRVTREHSFLPLFALSSIPNPFFDPASAIAGSLKIGFRQYFIPVLLGKTLRHVVIAFAGYYTISGDLASTLRKTSMIDFLNSGLFVGIVFCIALVAWLVRTFFESEPDPFLLNFTFFAFAGQCILTAEVVREQSPKTVIILGLLVPAMLVLLFQVLTTRAQVDRTLEHYAKMLDEHKINDRSSDEIERWAAVLVRITGVDFFPEFYQKYIKLGSARDKRRRQAISILPSEKFKTGRAGLTPETLIVPPEERRLLWRCYVALFIFSWLVFIACIVIARRPS